MDVLVPAQGALQRGIDAVGHLQEHGINEEAADDRLQFLARGVDGRNLPLELCERQGDAADEDEREHAREADVLMRIAQAACPDLIADEDRERHAHGERDHVDDRREVHRRLMRGDNRRAIRRHEQADRTEDTLLREHRAADRDADGELPPP